MQIAMVNRSNAENVYINVKNGFATTLTTGYVACFDFKNDSTGITVSQPQTGTNSCWYAIAGAAAENIATGGYGRLRAYGIGATYVSTETTLSSDLQVGQVIGLLTGQFYLTSTGLSDGKSGATFVVASQVISGQLTNTASIFIRAL